jgi:hypothetical protein
MVSRPPISLPLNMGLLFVAVGRIGYDKIVSDRRDRISRDLVGVSSPPMP